MTYLLLYIIFSRYKLAFFHFHLKEYLSNRLSFNCLWYDLIHKRNLCTYNDNLNMKRNLITSSNIGVENHIDYILKHISNNVLTLSTGPKVNLIN